MTGLRTAAEVIIALLGLLYLASFPLFGAVLWRVVRQPEPGADRLAVDDPRQRATAAAALQPDHPLFDADQDGQLAAYEIPNVAAEAEQYLRQHTPTIEES